jgi:hypothetical protein
MHSNKDKRIQITPNIKLKSFEKYNLIDLGYRRHFFVNVYLYLLFTFLEVVEIYKIYLNCLCITYSFEIKKLISFRSNLAPICPPEIQKCNDNDIERNNIHDDIAVEPVIALNEISKNEKIEGKIHNVLCGVRQKEENKNEYCYKESELEDLDKI